MWTDQQILAAVDAGLETATNVLDQDRQAVLFWKEWAAMEPHVPISWRKSLPPSPSIHVGKDQRKNRWLPLGLRVDLHPGSVSEGPEARKRPPETENGEKK